MTSAERQLLLKTAENLAGALSLLSDARLAQSNPDTLKQMAMELLRLTNAVQDEEVDRLVNEKIDQFRKEHGG